MSTESPRPSPAPLLVLGIECSGTTGGVALLGPDRLAGALSFTSATLYSQRLLPGIAWLLERTGLQPADVRGVAVSRGPGSFTGLRIGLSVAKAFAFANGIPAVGVGTLEAQALRAAPSAPGLPVCVVLDARQGEVFAGLFRVDWPRPSTGDLAPPAPVLTRLREDYAGKIATLGDWCDGPTLFAGEGTLRYRAQLAEMMGSRFIPAAPMRMLPSGEEVAALGMQRLVWGDSDDPALLEPDYLRRSYTERRQATG